MLDKLKVEIEGAAFMLAGNESRDKIHAKLLNCLVILNTFEKSDTKNKALTDDTAEINKVARRLKIWSKAGRQKQYNSKILNAYLALSNDGQLRITVQQLENFLNNPPWFSSNFTQMKTIADKNHGKIFDVTGDQVSIWPPIKKYVEDYKITIPQNGS